MIPDPWASILAAALLPEDTPKPLGPEDGEQPPVPEPWNDDK